MRGGPRCRRKKGGDFAVLTLSPSRRSAVILHLYLLSGEKKGKKGRRAVSSQGSHRGKRKRSAIIFLMISFVRTKEERYILASSFRPDGEKKGGKNKTLKEHFWKTDERSVMLGPAEKQQLSKPPRYGKKEKEKTAAL